MKFHCDRCGEVINGEPLKMIPSSLDKLTSMYIQKNLVALMIPLVDMDFCQECLEEIVDFAQNKNVCDECVAQMMDEYAMLREEAEETGPSTKIEPDPDEINGDKALDRMEQCRVSVEYLIPAEKVKEVRKILKEECQYESGQHIIPVQFVDSDLISKYRMAIEKYGVPKQCVNIPVTFSSDRSEGT